MTLSQRLSEYIAAAFTGLWIHSFEHEDALAEIARLCQEQQWSLAAWDIDRGLQIRGAGDGAPAAAAEASDPRDLRVMRPRRAPHKELSDRD